jgi:hypothetical protein
VSDLVFGENAWYVVRSIAKWQNLEINLGSLNMGPEQLGSIGFLPVFADEEKAIKYRDDVSPSASIVVIAASGSKEAEGSMKQERDGMR